MLMIYVVLTVLGLAFGSFVNALVWRIREQADESKKKSPDKKYLGRLSVSKGRSMCPHCKHELAAKDLLPVLSWLSLRGKCRYCGQAISSQYPLVELATVALFVGSYIWWPVAFDGSQKAIFILWLALLVGFMALIVYDLRWLLLPDRVMRPLSVLAGLMAVVTIAAADHPLRAILDTLLAVGVGGGIFYLLFQVSDGKWIGGGDVKLGGLLGLVAGTPARSLLMIFTAAFLGSLISLPMLATKRLKGNSIIPFGPFLIIGAIIVQLFGQAILLWYKKTFLPFTP